MFGQTGRRGARLLGAVLVMLSLTGVAVPAARAQTEPSVSEMFDDLTSVRGQLDAANAQLVATRDQQAVLQGQIAEVDGQIDALRARITATQAHIDDLVAQREAVRETIREHIFGCFIEESSGLRSLDIIGEDNVMCETDYPHSDTTWPDCIGVARKLLDDAGLSADTQYKILRGNAEKLYRFTPAEPPVAS